MKFTICLFILLIQEVFLIQADELCYYYNQSSTASINCNDICCSDMAMSAQSACCASITWSTLAVPVFIVSGVCVAAVCLVYFRPLFKFCLRGHRCPCGNRSRANDNPVYVMNTGDLPDYEAVTKDTTPPPYNFVTTHPTDFGIEARVPSAPPQYRSRTNSVAVVGPTPVEL